MIAYEIGWLGVFLAVFAGAIRVGTPFLFVSLGECLTEKSGRINLGLEGTLVMGGNGWVCPCPAQWFSLAGGDWRRNDWRCIWPATQLVVQFFQK